MLIPEKVSETSDRAIAPAKAVFVPRRQSSMVPRPIANEPRKPTWKAQVMLSQPAPMTRKLATRPVAGHAGSPPRRIRRQSRCPATTCMSREAAK
jgi:hypothetical protein